MRYLAEESKSAPDVAYYVAQDDDIEPTPLPLVYFQQARTRAHDNIKTILHEDARTHIGRIARHA